MGMKAVRLATAFQRNIHGLDIGAIIATMCLETFYYFRIHYWKWPNFAWFDGFDQGHYIEAARAWSAGNLDATAHYYLPGYALLAAGFVRMFPTQPFMLVDFACLVLTFGLFVAICRHLLPESRYATLLACLAFLIATLSVQEALIVWVVPWTTTPAAPLTLWALLAALHFAQHPSARPSFLAAFAAALIAWFRPADSASVLACLGVFMAWVALNRRVAVWDVAKYAAVALAGVVLAVAPLLAVHTWIFGTAPGPYLTYSEGVGFEWRLIPIRWVTIVLDPRPLFAAPPGLIAVFPWILPGIAGWLFRLLRKPREADILAGGAIALCWLLFLSYRGLEVPNFWRFYNDHYFKWTQPFLAFYALLWVRGLVHRPGYVTAALTGAAVVAALLPWRASLDIYDASTTTITRQPDGRPVLTLPEGLSHLHDAVLLTTGVGWQDVNNGFFDLSVAGQRVSTPMTLGVYSRSPGLMILPLRALPAAPATLVLDRQVAVDQQETLILAHQRITYGLPCLLASWEPACPAE
jgi:hypothetical protein